MHVHLDYGQKGLNVEVPDTNLLKVLQMHQPPPLADPLISVTKSLLKPIGISSSLFDLAKRKKSACVVICDITRPVPNRQLLPPILRTLLAAGIDKGAIEILIATGIHRPNLGDELIELVGEKIAEEYRIVNHNGRDLASHVNLGKTSYGDAEIWIDKRFVEAELKIITGFIEPHFMAGFSGGRKLVVPGISSIETMKYLHGPEILSHPNSREGVIEGNPFHQVALQVAQRAGVDFIVNVALNENKEIVGIFSGDLNQAHLAGIEFVREHVGDTVSEAADIVITTAGGYPLDKTWYQAVKGATSAVPIVKKGGTIILVSECSEGIGSPDFIRLMQESKDLDRFVDDIFNHRFFVIDQWQLQKYADVLKHAEVITVSEGLTAEQKDSIHIDWAEDIQSALTRAIERHGSHARIAVLPKGPYILASIA
ncbi:nickel-dependent lactate racemase [candidate division KSB1 bacterium]|nr:nickel-dependent lactate racemase [candidate division KSB1 bacterium]